MQNDMQHFMLLDYDGDGPNPFDPPDPEWEGMDTCPDCKGRSREYKRKWCERCMNTGIAAVDAA